MITNRAALPVLLLPAVLASLATIWHGDDIPRFQQVPARFGPPSWLSRLSSKRQPPHKQLTLRIPKKI
jgi:hypothetical protein